MKEKIKLSTTLPVSPEIIYKAWLNSKEHAAFTGAAAKITAKKGSPFNAWDGYISGKNLELEPNKRIIQSWRTTEFSETDDDSTLEILLEGTKKSTKLTLIHTNIPEGQGKSYKQGWKDFYFVPMKKYFLK
jgi:activator of HSP90 ATPase